MSKPELTALLSGSGTTLDCRHMGAISNPRIVGLERCGATMPDKNRRLEFILAPNQEGVLRVALIFVRGSSADAADARAHLVGRWGEHTRTVQRGDRTTLYWSITPRGLVMIEGCGRGEAFCIEYSDNSWARRAARAAGMDVALPQP